MSEIDRKSALPIFSSFSEHDSLLSTTPGSVAAAISSALETTAEYNTALTELEYRNFYDSHCQQKKYNSSDKGSSSVKKVLVNTGNLQNQQQSPLLLPVPPLQSDGFTKGRSGNNEQSLLTSGGNNRKIGRRNSSESIDSADGNHVDGQFKSSSTCSQLLHQTSILSSSFSSSSLQMADKQDYSSGSFSDSKTNVGDKSDNRETYQVSHYKEKSATDTKEVDSGGGRVFNPSSKIIDLPEKGTSSHKLHHSSHHHHHHHHSRNKDSRIPVGIAVAWQRLVTTSSTSPSTTSTITTKADCGNQSKSKMSNTTDSSSIKYPSRPLSASSLKNMKNCNSAYSTNSYSTSHPNLSGVGSTGDNNSDILSSNSNININRPMSACGDAISGGVGGTMAPFCPSPASPALSRPLPSSSVPPNLDYPGYSSHYPYHHRSSPYLEYPYGTAAATRPFVAPSPVPSPHHHHSHPSLLTTNSHPYWGMDNPPPPPILSSGIPASPGVAPADYLQLSLQQQQMHLHSSHQLHQEHLIATANRQISSHPTTYNPYLHFLHPQDATSLTAVAAAAATMNKGPYYDQYFHHQQQQQQMLLQNQGYHQPMNRSIPTSSGVNNTNTKVGNSNNNGNANKTGSSNSNSASGFDLLANRNNNSDSIIVTSASINTHRAIPMQVASPISRTTSSLLSCSHTGAGEIRTQSPTESSTSSKTAVTTITTATVTSSTGSAFSSATTSQTSVGSSSQSQELTASTSSITTTSSSPSPSLFLLHHQQQHPHLFNSSALSPKSLTSSTPSPVTIHDFNLGNVVISSSAAANNSTTTNTNNMAVSSRKCTTPSPISLTPTRALLSPFPPGSPYSPSPVPNNNNNNNGNYKELLTWKEDVSFGTKIKPIPINGHTKETHSSGGGSLTTPPPLSPLLSLAHHNNMRNNNNKITSVSTPMSSPSSYAAGQKHDFKRLESLIERRDSESISPLVLIPQHSPATSTNSSLLDSSDEQLQVKLATVVSEEKEVSRTDITPESQDSLTETFCISVKLENTEAAETVECQRRSNNKEDDSSKVIPTTNAQRFVQVSGTNAGKQDINICMMKPDTEEATEEINASNGDRSSKLGVKVEISNASNNVDNLPARPTSSHGKTLPKADSTCDANVGETEVEGDEKSDTKSQHGGLRTKIVKSSITDDKTDDAKLKNDEVIKENDVPEPTLLLCSTNSFNDINNTSTDDYFKTINSFTTDKNNQTVNIKDVSFTSGYSSSQEDNNEQQKQSLLIMSPSNTRNSVPLKNAKQTTKGQKQLKPSLNIKNINNKKEKKNKEKIVKDKKLSSTAKVDNEPTKGKRNKTKDKSNDISKAVGTLIPTTPKHVEKKTLNVYNDALGTIKKSKQEKGQQIPKTKHPLLSSSGFVKVTKDIGKIKKEKKTKVNKESKAIINDGFNGKFTSKIAVEKVKNNTLEVVGEKKKGKSGEKVTAKKPKNSLGTSKSKKSKESSTKHENTKVGPLCISQESWVPPVVPVNPAVTKNYHQFVKSKSDTGSSSYFVSPDMTSVNGDIINSESNSGSLTVSKNPPQQQQSMAVILHQPSPGLQSPSQVTFLITSPTSDRTSGATSPLRIPAYIPRSAGTISNATTVVASTDELVGESCNGPATLTLHRDVSSPQQTFYQPAITIQYHHSAPATPMTMEAASPSSLDLLATVAQEFGSREDLGKRMSIDGGSSCNASSIGESPPMSPQKSPYNQHHQHYSLHSNTLSNSIPTTQKQISNHEEIINAVSSGATTSLVPAPTQTQQPSSLLGKQSKPIKKAKLATKSKSDPTNTKTSNSITLKQSSRKAMKVGKKEKRTVSDSAFYTSPVVLLKIPQVPGLCSKKALQQQDKSKKTKEKQIKVKVDDNRVITTGAVSKSKQKPISNKKVENNETRDGKDKPALLNKREIQTKRVDSDKTSNKKKNKKQATSSSSTSSVSPSKSLLLLSLPTTSTTKANEEKMKKKGKKEKKQKSESSPISSSPLVSPLSSLSPKTTLTLSTSKTSDQVVTTTSPTKERSSSFYNPPERISAFAKQVISRRSSSAGSPTKLQINNNATTSPLKQQQRPSSAFFPIKQQALPNSPTIKMPQLIPFDAPTELLTSNSPSPKHSCPITTSSTTESHYDSSSSVPKTVNLKKFPNSSKNSPPHLPPPLLIPSINSSSHAKKDHCDDNDDTRFLSSLELDNQKTDNVCITKDKYSGSKSKRSIKEKSVDNKKDSKKRKNEEKDGNEDKKAKKKRQSSKQEDIVKKERPKTKKKKSGHSPTIKATVPKITISPQLSPSHNVQKSPSVAFSPLTPPLTAKSNVEGEDDGIKGYHSSAFASLQVHAGSSTPSSSLASRRSSPSTNADEEGETETTTENENETDSNNVWVADPMFAVSAIKLTNISSAGSNQPTDVEESADDDDNGSNKEIKNIGGQRKDTTALKSSLSNYKQQKEIPPLSPKEKEGLFEVKSQLKAFVHFKPKQCTGNKGHTIKPCLKAEPIVRSHTMDDDDEEVIVDDDDFHLDMEVAKITTQNAPGKKTGAIAKKSVASIPATSSSIGASTGSNKKRKPSINRNSSSYVTSNSSMSSHSKTHQEIMTKVFSRKVSPDLSERKIKKRRSSSCVAPATEMDADDEDDEEEELLDIDDAPLRVGKSHTSHNTHISMSAAAAAVVVNSNNVHSAPSISSLSSSSLTLLSTLSSPSSSAMKKPKKRSARSSTTSSSASTKSNSRGNKGQTTVASANTCSSASGVASNTRASAAPSSANEKKDETQVPGKVELDSVEELVDEMRILTDIQGLFYTGRLNALQPPDVYGVTLDNERGAPPHLIFSAEEVLEKCLREKKPQPEGLCAGLRICAYWSPQYSGLYPGRVSSDFSPKFDPEKDLIPIEFDDGDTGMIKLKEIRLLSVNHPVREYDPNPLLTLEKKHRKRRHSSATGTSGGCTGDHEEPDCGEPYCAKIGKLEEDEDADDDNTAGGSHHHHSSSKMLYWTWSGLGYKRPKSKKNRNKEFFHGIQRGDEVINVGDAALFISTGNERPFIGRVERFWERKGKKMVNVRWFYHPEEVKASAKRLSNLKYPGALFESPHIDENDVQTIAKKCDVLPFPEFKKRLSGSSAGSLRVAKLSAKSSSKPRDMYYVAGFYDPYTYNLTLKELK